MFAATTAAAGIIIEYWRCKHILSRISNAYHTYILTIGYLIDQTGTVITNWACISLGDVIVCCGQRQFDSCVWVVTAACVDDAPSAVGSGGAWRILTIMYVHSLDSPPGYVTYPGYLVDTWIRHVSRILDTWRIQFAGTTTTNGHCIQCIMSNVAMLVHNWWCDSYKHEWALTWK